MSNEAQVTGLVQYRAGDGPLLDIPQGPIEVELAADSAVVTWTHEDESLNTAIPLQDYEKYVAEGAIVKNG
ncbi:MAG: hypothetical protein EOP12_03015 [Pseudomonas sp.]|nr:MAG: hypothetical protein EOP12_03015 [Pseudomonas sp.]